jgi:hypothetical protein
VLLVVPCSKRKSRGGFPGVRDDTGYPWSSELRAARARLAGTASVDERLLLPACERYTGNFYGAAGPALGGAAAAAAHVVILSGGYGIVTAAELIGWYERKLSSGDWPLGLLGRELMRYALSRGLRRVVAFAAASSPYATVVREAPWAAAGVESVLLVTAEAPGGGAQVVVPRDPGRAFAACWAGSESVPDTVRVLPVG